MICVGQAQPKPDMLPARGQGNLQWILRPMTRMVDRQPEDAPLKESSSPKGKDALTVKPKLSPRVVQPVYQVLLHQVDRDAPDTWRQVAQIKGDIQLASLAAVDQNLYVVFGPNRVYQLHRQPAPQSTLLTDVVKMHVQLNLPDPGQVQSAAANDQGYWLVFEPQLTVSKITKQKQTPQDARVLMHLDGQKWETLPLPEAVLELKQLKLITTGRDHNKLGFVGIDHGKLVDVSQKDDQWVTHALSLPIGKDQKLHSLNVEGQSIVAVSQQDNKQLTVALHLLVNDEAIDLGKFELRDESVAHWAVLTMGQKVGLVVVHADDTRTLRTMDLQGHQLEEPVKITIGDPTDMLNQPGRLIVSMALMAAVLVMFGIWRRDPANAKVTLPKGYQVAALSKRFLAVMIDLIPCGMVSSFAFGITMLQLIDQWPGMAITWEQLLPGLLTIALFTLHTTLSEVFTAQTLGKKMMGLTVCTMSGQQPDLWQVLLRNLLKILDLVAWYVLPMLVIVSAYRQRLGDVVARTVVVQRSRVDMDD